MNLTEEDPLLNFQQSVILTRTVEKRRRRSFWRGKDGALGWTVAIAIMLINFITIGLGRMSGILYVDFMREYHVNRKFASAPFSLQQSTRNLFGPVAGLLGYKFGLRALTMAGGLIGAISAAACAFAVDITWVIVFWGALYGIGIAFTSTLNQVILDEYFEKYLSSASGLSFSGGSLGAIVFAFALQRTIDDYGMDTSFIIMGVVILLVVPLAITLTSPPWTNELDSPGGYEDSFEKRNSPILPTERRDVSSEDENELVGTSSFWPSIKSQSDILKKDDNEKIPIWSKQRRDDTEKSKQSTKRNLTYNLIFARLKTFGEIFNIGKESLDKMTTKPKYDIESELISEAESKIENAAKQKLYTDVQTFDDEKAAMVRFINENSRKNDPKESAVIKKDTQQISVQNSEENADVITPFNLNEIIDNLKSEKATPKGNLNSKTLLETNQNDSNQNLITLPNDDTTLIVSNKEKYTFKSKKNIPQTSTISEISQKSYPKNSVCTEGDITDKNKKSDTIDINVDKEIKSNTIDISIDPGLKYNIIAGDSLAKSRESDSTKSELKILKDDKNIEILESKKINKYKNIEDKNEIDKSYSKISDLICDDTIASSSNTSQKESAISIQDFKSITPLDKSLNNLIITEEDKIEILKEDIPKSVIEEKSKKKIVAFREEEVKDQINITTPVSVEEKLNKMGVSTSFTLKEEKVDTSEKTVSNVAKEELSAQNIIRVADEIQKLAQASTNENLKQIEKKKKENFKDKKRNQKKKNASKKEYQKNKDRTIKITEVDNAMISDQKLPFDEKDTYKTNAAAPEISEQDKKIVDNSLKTKTLESKTNQTIKSIDISPESFVVEKYVLKEVKEIDTDLVTSLDEQKCLLLPNQSLSTVKEDVEKAVTMGKTLNEEIQEFNTDLVSKIDRNCQEFVSNSGSMSVKEDLDKVTVAKKLDQTPTPTVSLISSESFFSNKQGLTESNLTQDSIQNTAEQLLSEIISTEEETLPKLKKNIPVTEHGSKLVKKEASTFHPSFDSLDFVTNTTPFLLEEDTFQANEMYDESNVIEKNIALPPLSLEGTSRDYSYSGSIISSPIDTYSVSADAVTTVQEDISLRGDGKTDKERKIFSKGIKKLPVPRYESAMSNIPQDGFSANVESLRKKYDETETSSQISRFQETSLVMSNSTADSLFNLQENIDIDFLRENTNFVIKVLHNGENTLSKKDKNYGTMISNDKVLQEELETLYNFIEFDSLLESSLSKRTAECEHSCSKCGLIYKAEEKISFDTYSEEFIRSSELFIRLKETFLKDESDILPDDDSNKEHVGKVITEMRKMYEYVNMFNYLKNPPESLTGQNGFAPNNFCSQCCPDLEPVQLVLKLYLNPAFLVICLSRAIHLLTFMGILTIIVDFSIDRGLKESTGRCSVALMSLGDLIGRLFTGWITDNKIISLEKFMLLAMFFIGVISIAFPVVPANSLLVFSCIYSILQGSVFIRHPVLVSKYTRVEERTVGMGFMTLFSGLLGLVLPYYIGYFRDYIGSYNQVFYINGGLCIVIGSLWILEPWLKRYAQ